MQSITLHNDLDIHAMARDIDASGLAAAEASVRELASLAQDAGVSPVLVDVLRDARQPEVARTRAISKILLAMGRNTRHVLAA